MPTDSDLDVGYLLIMSAAILVGAIVRRYAGPSLDLPRAQRFAILVGAIVGGALGAKVPWLVMDPEGLVSGAVWLSDGRTITFGLVGGYFGVEVAKLSAGVRTKTGDGFAVPLAASIAVGRLGCFWSGCCFGMATHVPWGVDFGDGFARHPTQLYEVFFHASAALALYQLGKRGLFPRQRIKLYFLAYFVYRFFTEWLRPEPQLALGLTLYQWTSVAFILLFVVLWWVDRRPVADEASESFMAG